MPALLRIKFSHIVKYDRKKMSDCKVGNKNFNQSKVLLFPCAVNKKILKFVKFFNIIEQFKHCK